MKQSVFDIQGKEKQKIDLSDSVFNTAVNDHIIYEAVKSELANIRQGTVCTKDRAEVIGSTKKFYRQKGTGRARVGAKTSPVWRGGGVVFGPKPRDFSYSVPRKIKRKSVFSVLSKKVQGKSLKIVEDFSVNSGKTKDLVSIIYNWIKPEKTVLIIGNDDNLIKRAGKNVPWLQIFNYKRLRVHDLFYAKNIIITEQAVAGLENMSK